MSLVIAPCSFDAAKYAVMNWHYSQAMPAGKLVKYGVWENDKFIGAVIYGRGANKDLGKPYGLEQIEICELVRVALTKHEATVSQIVAQSIKQLKKENPGIRLIISFADPEKNHKGGIYQAGNWIYNGCSQSADEYIVNGERIHGRSLRAKRKSHPIQTNAKNALIWAQQVLDPNAQEVKGSSKHRYLYPLDRNMRKLVSALSLPYPSAVEGSIVSRDTSGIEGQVQSLPTAQRS